MLSLSFIIVLLVSPIWTSIIVVPETGEKLYTDLDPPNPSAIFSSTSDEEFMTLTERLKGSLIRFQRANRPSLAIDNYIVEYAEDMVIPQFVACAALDDHKERFQFLCGHYMSVFNQVPTPLCFKTFQREAFRLGRPNVAVDLYEEHIPVFRSIYGYPGLAKKKTLSAQWPTIMEKSLAFVDEFKANRAAYASTVQELYGVPEGIEAVIDFCTRQLLLRLKTIDNSVALVAKSLKGDLATKKLIISLAKAISTRRFQIHVYLRRLLKIKRMAAEAEQRVAMGELASYIGWFKYRDKLPQELIDLIDFLPVYSSEWFYCFLKLERFLMNCDGDFDKLIQPQIFFENVVLGRLLIALRSEAAEPYKSYLKYIVMDSRQHPDNMEIKAHIEYVEGELGSYPKRTKITDADCSRFFSVSLPNAMAGSYKKLETVYCLPLTEDEIAELTLPVEEDTVEPVVLLCEALPVQSKKPRRKRNKNKKTANSSTSMSSSPPSMAVDVVDESCDVEIPNESVSGLIEKKVDEDAPIDVAQPAAAVSLEDRFKAMLKPQVIEWEIDQSAADKAMTEYERTIAEFKALKTLPTFHVNPLSNASHQVSIDHAPAQLDSRKHKVVRLHTEDFVALIPELGKLYQENLNADMANEVPSNARFRWFFDETVEIGRDEYIFLCQVFSLCKGTDKLKWSNFLKTIRKMAATCGPGRTVFKFKHVFVIDGQICVPPIGGAHPEHASSPFNLSCVKDLLMHGACHPYFCYRVIK